MNSFSVLDPSSWHSAYIKENKLYASGQRYGWLSRETTKTSTDCFLSGRLYVSKSGWLLLSVPNALVHGVFDALAAPGAELPMPGALNVPNVPKNVLNAHISVMTADEVSRIGADRISERGHSFYYALGGLKEVPAKNIAGISKLWLIEAASPDLVKIRKSYGLSATPNNLGFHVTVAVRRKKVLQENSVRKAAADKLDGGAADNVPDAAFSKEKLQEGRNHEREHTNDDQIAKEIAKDHLQEDPAYYEKVEKIEKTSAGTGSVYGNQFFNIFNNRKPITYDHNKPVFENIRNQLAQIQRRGDFVISARRNNHIYRAALDPRYRYELAMKAYRGEYPQESFADRFIYNYGNQMLGQLGNWAGGQR
jgi:hypothetical protein